MCGAIRRISLAQVMRELALFAGAGGGILGGMLAGWHTVCAVERDAYRASILALRQNDGFLAPFPIWSDVCSFDAKPWRGIIDVVSAGFPCQDISVAGGGAGLDGERSGPGWRETWRITCEVQPRYLWLENSPAILGRGAYAVLAEIAKVGGVARWEIVSGDAYGAWHERKRWWLVADFDGVWEQQSGGADGEIGRRVGDGVAVVTDADRDIQQSGCKAGNEPSRRFGNGIARIIEGDDADFDGAGRQKQRRGIASGQKFLAPQRHDWWAAEPGVVRMVHGLAHRVDRIAALGNGQVPIVACRAWERLTHD